MKTAKEARYHSRSGGQIVSTYFSMWGDASLKRAGWEVLPTFLVGAVVSDSINRNNRWWSGEKSGIAANEVTGKIGIRSFIKIESAFFDFISSVKSKEMAFFIDGTDERRRHAYRRLISRAIRRYGAGISMREIDNGVLYVRVTK